MKPSDLQSSYDRVADEYAWRIYHELQHKPLDRQLLDRFADAARAMGLACDMGCGPGQIARYLHERGMQVCGVDLSPGMVARARALNPGIEFTQGDMYALDVQDGAWAAIAAFYSIIHVPRDDVVPTLQELRRVLQPGGLLLLAFHIGDDALHLDEWMDQPVCVDFFYFRPDEMAGYLKSAGFEIDEIIERDPYADVEHQSRRAYIFARKPRQGTGMAMKPMYSPEWFETFATTVPAAIMEADLDGITALLPRQQYPRLLDVGCGIGRIAGPLSSRGYAVMGLDISVEALLIAQRHSPGPRYVALDQRHVGQMRWSFDGALVLWNSIGFVGRSADLDTMEGLARSVRPGGKVVLDLYHPAWLQRNERAGESDQRGAVVRRWVRDGRCFHEIEYPGGRVDDIQFDVYLPEEIRHLAERAGLQPAGEMVLWQSEIRPSADAPRYQFVCVRP